MRTAEEAREQGVDDGSIVLFDAHASTWTATGDMDTGRPVWEYLAGVKQGDVLIGVPDRFSVYGFAWPADYKAPTHFHDVDQIQLIVTGEAWMGSRRLRPGQGVFTPAGRAYNFSTGPAGCTMLEFRSQASFRTAYKERDVDMLGRPIRFGGVVDPDPTIKPQTEIPEWTPPDSVGKPVFFDAETCEPTDDLLGDGTVRVQHLVAPSESTAYTLTGLDMKPASSIPSHSQSAHRVLFVLSGEVEADGAALRHGQGLYVPAGAELSCAAGPVGARFVEFRSCAEWTTTWV